MFSNILKMLRMEGGVVESSPESYMSAMKLIAGALNTAGLYMLHGSGACLLHGVQFNKDSFPSDIDISVADLVKATKALEAAAQKGLFTIEQMPTSSQAVSRFMITLKSGEKVELDLTSLENFGLQNASIDSGKDIKVTSIPETLLSLYLREKRYGKRDKDTVAFELLVEKHRNYLQKENGECELLELAQKTKNPGFVSKVKAILDNTPENTKKTEYKLLSTDNIPASFLDPKYNSPKAREREPSIKEEDPARYSGTNSRKRM